MPPAEGAAAAAATAAPKPPKAKKGTKKERKKGRKKGAAQDDDGCELADDDGAALAPTQTWTAPTTNGDSDSAGASSAGAASQKNKHKEEKEKEKVPLRTSRRAVGEAAPEADLVKAGPRRKASGSEAKASSAGGTGKMDALIAATTASGAEPASDGAQGDGDVFFTRPARVADRPDLLRQPGHKNREN